jgi:hypothetical protein
MATLKAGPGTRPGLFSSFMVQRLPRQSAAAVQRLVFNLNSLEVQRPRLSGAAGIGMGWFNRTRNWNIGQVRSSSRIWRPDIEVCSTMFRVKFKFKSSPSLTAARPVQCARRAGPAGSGPLAGHWCDSVTHSELTQTLNRLRIY